MRGRVVKETKAEREEGRSIDRHTYTNAKHTHNTHTHETRLEKVYLHVYIPCKIPSETPKHS